MVKLTAKAQMLTLSNIRQISKQCHNQQGINLGQGVCDLPLSEQLSQAAKQAIDQGHNAYAPYEGIPELRRAIRQKMATFNQIELSSDDSVLVTQGVTAGLVCAIEALLEPNDEVIMFEPFYRFHYHLLTYHHVNVKTVHIDPMTGKYDPDELINAVSSKTKAILLCNPHNPTGHVFTEQELTQIGQLAIDHDLAIISDEIYEYVTYHGQQHHSIAKMKHLADRTVTVTGFSKTYHVTGWRIGYLCGPQAWVEKMALIHDTLYMCTATPFQHAALVALAQHDTYYEQMRYNYQEKRDYLIRELNQLGFETNDPKGTYYLLVKLPEQANQSHLFAQQLLSECNVAVLAGSEFYHDAQYGQDFIRLCFAKPFDEIKQAVKAFSDCCPEG